MAKVIKSEGVRYLAFLRGINVGGHLVKMADLKEVFVSLKLSDVKTYLASGNAAFATSEKDIDLLTKKIETGLKKKFGFEIPTILKTDEELKKLHASDPFKGITVTKDTRLYVTFLKDSTKVVKPKVPLVSFDDAFKILRVTEYEIFSVLVLDGESRTIDFMNIIGKAYGRNVTTRNWNTVLKMIKD